MRVAITGATGMIGSRVAAALDRRGDDVIAFSRDPDRARRELGTEAVGWDPVAGPAPEAPLCEADAVVNLTGEPVAQRWTAEAKERIRASRVTGTRNLVEGIQAAWPRPRTLVSASAAGYYGDRGADELPETEPAGSDFLASLCVEWEAAAEAAAELGVRVVRVRTGVVLDREGGALKEMVPPFRAGVGGPIAGGRQYMPWIHLEDVVGIIVAALDGTSGPGGGPAMWSGAVNASAPAPATNKEFSRALGRALRRPALIPIPEFAIRRMYGEMASVLTSSQRMVPARALELGYEFRYPELGGALGAALGR
jgi:uncharacterized protein (TIGR01777 family)